MSGVWICSVSWTTARAITASQKNIEKKQQQKDKVNKKQHYGRRSFYIYFRLSLVCLCVCVHASCDGSKYILEWSYIVSFNMYLSFLFLPFLFFSLALHLLLCCWCPSSCLTAATRLLIIFCTSTFISLFLNENGRWNMFEAPATTTTPRNIYNKRTTVIRVRLWKVMLMMMYNRHVFM